MGIPPRETHFVLRLPKLCEPPQRRRKKTIAFLNRPDKRSQPQSCNLSKDNHCRRMIINGNTNFSRSAIQYRAVIIRLIAFAVLPAALLAQWPAYKTASAPRLADGKVNLDGPVPRTADGHPDLSGIWDRGLVPGAPLPAPANT